MVPRQVDSSTDAWAFRSIPGATLLARFGRRVLVLALVTPTGLSGSRRAAGLDAGRELGAAGGLDAADRLAVARVQGLVVGDRHLVEGEAAA